MSTIKIDLPLRASLIGLFRYTLRLVDLQYELLLLGKVVKFLLSLLQPTDVLEWHLVTQEVEQFLEADSLPSGNSTQSDRLPGPLPIRCQPESPLVGVPFTAPFLQLHEAVLASYWHKQVKLGDLPLDMIRMLQALEWDDPVASKSQCLDLPSCTGGFGRPTCLWGLVKLIDSLKTSHDSEEHTRV